MKYLFIAAAALLATSCSKDDESKNVVPSNELGITAARIEDRFTLNDTSTEYSIVFTADRAVPAMKVLSLSDGMPVRNQFALYRDAQAGYVLGLTSTASARFIAKVAFYRQYTSLPFPTWSDPIDTIEINIQ